MPIMRDSNQTFFRNWHFAPMIDRFITSGTDGGHDLIAQISPVIKRLKNVENRLSWFRCGCRHVNRKTAARSRRNSDRTKQGRDKISKLRMFCWPSGCGTRARASHSDYRSNYGRMAGDGCRSAGDFRQQKQSTIKLKYALSMRAQWRIAQTRRPVAEQHKIKSLSCVCRFDDIFQTRKGHGEIKRYKKRLIGG